MRKRIAKSLLVLAAISAFGALPAVSQARQGADDPVTHNAGDNGPGHH